MTHPSPLLRAEDVQPYLSGCNVLRHSNSKTESADVFAGEIKKITLETDGGEVTAIVIDMSWLVRIRDAPEGDGYAGSHDWKPIPKTLQKKYQLRFENPLMTKKRSPLTFESGDETVEIAHVTELARNVLSIKTQLEQDP